MNDVYLSYLPLAHIFDRIIEECFISHGAQIGFWRGVRWLPVIYSTSMTVDILVKLAIFTSPGCQIVG